MGDVTQKNKGIDYRMLSLLTAEQAHTFRVIPAADRGDHIALFGDAPALAHTGRLGLLLGKPARIQEISGEALQQYLHRYYPYEGNTQGERVVPALEEESDVVRFVNKVLEEAATMEASDIHFERYEHLARIRFRWEGQLVEKYEVPLAQYNALISRIKILAELDISERRLPQDGRIHIAPQGKAIDIRVSLIPGKYGEKAVLRLLTRSQRHLQLDNLGMGESGDRAYRQAIRKTNGIILITGPTGSGKTTTLYATFNALNTPDKNILTIEDPIEYNLSGINQVQLKEEIGLSFHKALRAFLRQDPDIIMVGEIRDAETAQIAIRAALTGHLVFSTLHTNSAWDAITRLTDMGIEPYLLAASLRLVVAQRLLRMLCPHCKQESDALLFPEIQQQLALRRHHVPVGCPKCFYTGYRGRQAAFEVLPITRALTDRITSGAGDIQPYMQQTGLPLLRDTLAEWLQQGLISLEEAIGHLEG